jgi:hypothetical protein
VGKLWVGVYIKVPLGIVCPARVEFVLAYLVAVEEQLVVTHTADHDGRTREPLRQCEF